MPAPQPVHGLDIHAGYQPVSSWEEIPLYDVMSVKGTEGRSFVQKGSHAYFDKFRERGFRYRGMYHWYRSDSTPAENFQNVKKWWRDQGGMEQGEFNQNDWERTPNVRDPALWEILEYNDRCQQEWPDRNCVYASDWMPFFLDWLMTKPREPLWYANYNTSDKRTGGWAECQLYNAMLWQWTSSYISPGIITRCDANHLFAHQREQLNRIAGYYKPLPPTIEIPVTPPPPVPVIYPKENIMTANKFGVIYIHGAHAQFMGPYFDMVQPDGRIVHVFPEVKWISNVRQIETRDKMIELGASVVWLAQDDLRYTYVDKVPLGDGLTVWSEDHFAGVG